MRLVLLVLALVACHHSLPPPPPLEAIKNAATLEVVYTKRVAPLRWWAQVYQEVEACTGVRGDFSSVQWFVTSRAIPNEGGGFTDGWWRKTADGRRQIILVVDDTAQVRHEILHDVLWMSGWRPTSPLDDGHPQPPFGTCAPR